MNLKSCVLKISTFILKTATVIIESFLMITLSSPPFWRKVYKLKNIWKVISLKIKIAIFLFMLFIVFCYNFIFLIAFFISLGILISILEALPNAFLFQ